MGLYKNQDGIWGIDYRYPPGREGKRIREPIGTKKEAEIVLGRRREAIRLGQNPELRKIQPVPFSEIVAEYLEKYTMIHKTESETDTSNSKRLLEHFKGTLQEIRPREIQDYISIRKSAGVSAGKINRERALLSGIFTFAIDGERYFGENPVKKVAKLEESPGRERYLTPKEAKALISKATDHLKPLIIAGLNTGGRLGELLKLRWEYVNLAGGVIRFERATTKGKKTRDVPISPELSQALRALASGRLKGGDARRDFVFTYLGKRIMSVHTAFNKARKDAGLGVDVGFHCTRHTFASWYVQRGGSLYALQKLLGHSTITLTARYSHLGEGYLQESMAFIGTPQEIGGRGVDENVKSDTSSESPSA